MATSVRVRRPRPFRRLKSLVSHGRSRLVMTGVVALGLTAAILIPGVNDAYPTTRVVEESGLAWVTSDQIGSLTLLDGVAGQPVVNIPVASNDGDSLLSEQAGTAGFALDQSTGRLTRIDGATYTPTAATEPPAASGDALQLLAGTEAVYVVDGRQGTVTVYSVASLRRAAVLPLARGSSGYSAVVDSAGRLWVLDHASGQLTGFSGATTLHAASAFTPGWATLVLAAGEPVVVDSATHRAYLIGPDGSVRASLALSPGSGTETQYSGTAGEQALLATDSSLGTYQICGFSTGTCGGPLHAGFSGDALGPAVTIGRRAFVPDYPKGIVWVLDLSGTTPPVHTATLTTAGPFNLFSQGGLVFYNDPRTSQAGTIAADGVPQPIVKYSTPAPVSGKSPAAHTSSPRPVATATPTHTPKPLSTATASPRPPTPSPSATVSTPAPKPTPTVRYSTPSPKPSGTHSGTPPPKPNPSGSPTPTPSPTKSGGNAAYCQSESSSSSISGQGGIPLSNADETSGDQPQVPQGNPSDGPPQTSVQPQTSEPENTGGDSSGAQTAASGREKREWGPGRIAIVGAILTGIPAAVIAGIFGLIQETNSSLPPSSSETTSLASPTSAITPQTSPAGTPQSVRPAFTLPDPNGRGVYGVAFTSDDSIVTGDLNGSAYLWNVTKGSVTSTFPDSNGQGIFGVAANPGGTLMAADTLSANYQKGSIVLWNTSTEKPTTDLTISGDAGFGNPPAFSPFGDTVAAASANGSIYLWNTTTGKPVGKPLTDPGSQIDYGIAFSPTTGFLAAADHNGTAYLWNTETGDVAQTFSDPDSQGVAGVAFNSDGSILATGDDNGNVYLWNVATGTLITTLPGPKGGTTQSIAFSPSGGIVAASSDGNGRYETCVWNLTGKLLATLQDPNSAGVTRIAFSPDGSMLAVGDENTNTYIWKMNEIGS